MNLLLVHLPSLVPDSASANAGPFDSLFTLLLVITGATALLVCVLVIFFAVYYRRTQTRTFGAPTKQRRWLELTWTIVPVFVFVYIFFRGATLYFDVRTPPPGALEIHVIGKQWMWKFQHPEGQREIDELHIPRGQAVKLMISSEDVIHSFFVPAFRIHMDAVPGQYNTVWFEPTKEGSYHLFCSQYCGSNHSRMIGRVVVMAPGDYERWLAEGGQDSLASRGERLFRKLACVECHAADSTARAPMLEGVFGHPVLLTDGSTVLADETYVRNSILRPKAMVVAGFQPIMPTYEGQLDEEQVWELVVYVRSLNGTRRQIPPVSSPEGPQPEPAGSAIRNSERQQPQSREAAPPAAQGTQ